MTDQDRAAEAAEHGAPALVAGIDIGGTKIAVLVTRDDGAVLARGVVPAPARQGGTAMADTAAELTRELVDRVGGRLRAVGVGAAGVVDPVDGTILAASAMFTDWVGFPLAAALSERLDAPVTVENDVNAFLLGEVAAGAGLGDDVLGVMLGTGVGGALVVDGALRHGPNGAAGEIGHTPGYGDLTCTCGQVGHLETLASGTSIARRYAERAGSEGIGAEGVASLAREGDADALAVFADAGRAVALACCSAATLIDVDVAVVGGGVAHAWDLLGPAITATLLTDAPVSGAPLRILPAALGSDAVALGAAAAARRRFAAHLADLSVGAA